MALASSDLTEIRNIVREEIEPVRGDSKALTNDIEEIYARLAALERSVTRIEQKIIPIKDFEKLNLEQKLLRLNSELLSAAKQAGITLPRL